ncbi:type VI secretion system ImpA family N-terminal domain-containing protein [Klebsiella pneumoniae]|nr:type VI secretion system ImpA family N-terminal domain-containing protein [Klebsiella pneumoniae]
MSILQNLVAASQLDESVLRQQARSRQAQWQSWLAPISDSQPTGSDPGYDDDFQRIREEVNKISGVDTVLICQLAGRRWLATTKISGVVTYYCWARLHQDGKLAWPMGWSCWQAGCNDMVMQLYPQRERSRKAALEWHGGTSYLRQSFTFSSCGGRTHWAVTVGALLLIDVTLSDDENQKHHGQIWNSGVATGSRLIERGSRCGWCRRRRRTGGWLKPSAREYEAPVLSQHHLGSGSAGPGREPLTAYLQGCSTRWLACRTSANEKPSS